MCCRRKNVENNQRVVDDFQSEVPAPLYWPKKPLATPISLGFKFKFKGIICAQLKYCAIMYSYRPQYKWLLPTDVRRMQHLYPPLLSIENLVFLLLALMTTEVFHKFRDL